MANFDLLETGATVLVTLNVPYTAGNGKTYRQVWGGAELVQQQDGTVFVHLGGIGNEMLISPQNISFVEELTAKPEQEGVLIRSTDDDEFMDAMLVHSCVSSVN